MDEDEKIHNQYLDMNAELTRKQQDVSVYGQELRKFYNKNRDAIERVRFKNAAVARNQKQARKEKNYEIQKQIYDYLKVGMWVKVKTNLGSIWQQVVEKNGQHGYYSVKCVRPSMRSAAIKFNKPTNTYILDVLEYKDIERSDYYSMNSVISVLVPAQSGIGCDEKSFRKEIVKK